MKLVKMRKLGESDCNYRATEDEKPPTPLFGTSLAIAKTMPLFWHTSCFSNSHAMTQRYVDLY